MHIFLYEFVTAGGWYSCGDQACPESLQTEAKAMVAALSADLMAISNVSLSMLVDHRFQEITPVGASVESVTSRFEELAAIKRQAAHADWTIVIAPEFAGFLAQRVAIAEKVGGRVLGPSLEVIRLTLDKHATAEHLANHGVRVPHGVALEVGESLPLDFAYPAVLKPRDGAGSQGVRLVESATVVEKVSDRCRLEVFHPGQPASVAFLCGPQGSFPLMPCRQHLSDDGRFIYRGGSLPLEPRLNDRALSIAARAIESLGTLHGYLGVDLVLGAADDGTDDVVIEINPRVTTSYVGLRAAARTNLAVAMLAIAEGLDSRIAFADRAIQFNSAGQISPFGT